MILSKRIHRYEIGLSFKCSILKNSSIINETKNTKYFICFFMLFVRRSIRFCSCPNLSLLRRRSHDYRIGALPRQSPTHQIIYDFGETTFKLSDNATPQTKNLLMVKYEDDVKMVNGVGKVTSQQIDDFLLTTKQGNKSKEKLILLT